MQCSVHISICIILLIAIGSAAASPGEGTCSNEEFQCSNRKCIRKSYLCDGEVDCIDGADEINCPGTCNIEEFQCSNGKYIRQAYLCDGEEDCIDGTDESNCSASSVDKCSDKTKRRCTRKGGQCQGSSSCDGTIIPNGCIGNCTCCVYDSEEIKLLGYTFLGNTSSSDDHFKLFLPDLKSNSLLVGGRNIIYNLSLYDLTEQNRFEWEPESLQMNSCYMKGGSVKECQNYVRVLKEKKDGEYLICGTNAYNPICRDFIVTNGVLESQREFSARGLCPFDPSHNSTSVYVDNQLYVGTIADFAGLEPLIYREPLRTEQYDLSKLYEPNFVSSFALGDYVYFFFREIAVEYMNCGKTFYSRVARVCRHDNGGPHKFRNKWTSYLKSRLNCSVPGDFPFYFNEIQATTTPIEGLYGAYAQTLIYGVFTTPENSLPGSAVCAFSFQDIMDTFEGQFKGQESVNANWLPINHTKVPEPRPGQCVRDSYNLPDVTLNFIKSHSLMDEAVPAFFDQPLLISTQFQYNGRFTSIEVDPQVKTPDGKNYDVLFVGTDDGKVLKAVNTQSYDSYKKVEPFIIEELQVFEPGTAIISLKVIRPTNKSPRLLVTSSSQIHSIPLWRCNTDKITLCRDCLTLRDPYCVWDKSLHICRATMNGNEILQGNEIIQSVASGTHAECMDKLLNNTQQETVQASHKSDLHSRNGPGDREDSSSDRSDVVYDDSDVIKFLGNNTHDHYFKLLLPDDMSNSLLVGGRNVIYNLSLYDLAEQNRLEWYPKSQDMSICYIKGRSEEECHNYVRVLTKKRNQEYLICGTNAYKPMCRNFIVANGVLEHQSEFLGRGYCPFDPSHNSTSVYVDDQLYAGTVSDFAGLDPLIYREPIRTEQYDLSVLNAPNFVSSFALGDYVYFFFREMAVEHMNCGKTLYSRVARVCRHDKGGPHKFRNKWTSYLKSRLNCSIAGNSPFYFNEIQATTAPVEGRYGGNALTLIYGVFTTPENSIPGSAVCAFTIQDIMDTFEGPFKGQESVNANWLPVQETKVPEPRPGGCVKDSSTLPDVTLNFTRTHSLMDEAVPALFGQPILISTSSHSRYSGRFTSIEVDPQVRTPDGKNYDVLFVGTDDGKVLKAVNSYESVEPFIIETIKAFEPGTAIISLKIIRLRNKSPRLLVTSRSQIHSIPLWRCNTDKISDCLTLRDPYCVWDKATHKCRATMNGT